ncbi:MAG: alpha-mannosidase [Chloroflexota bacterium]|nr:alpha-mannosidase [Chloroflexota bacterium]
MSGPPGERSVLHLIGNAHLDPVWLWRWQEGFHEVKATFASVLQLMDEYPDFRFTSSSAAIYEWIERNEPAMFEAIRRRVSENRWEICGGWWIQPDCNLPGGESFVRQGLYGQRYFKEKLGVTATTGYNVDSFGHHGMIPQILARSGMLSYVFMRPQPHEMELPGRVFWWQSPDGSRVLTFQIPYRYQTWNDDLEEHLRLCAAEVGPQLPTSMAFYGVGNHGGGPTRENLEAISRLADEGSLPELRPSTPGTFFRELEASTERLPVVATDLQHHASGCYAAHSGVKRWNRQAEHRLLAAEKLSSVAELVAGQPYPEELTHAWKLVLFNQFHDILAGTSLESAYEDARNEYGEALAVAGRSLNYAVQALSWRIHLEAQGQTLPLVVFNPHAWPARLPVEMELAATTHQSSLLDFEGEPVPCQRVRSEATVSGWRQRVCFLADLPPLGYSVYYLTSGAPQPPAPHLLVEAHCLENEALRVELDPRTGQIVRLYDKRIGTDATAGRGARPVVIQDPSDTWSHGVFRFDDEVGEFSLVSIDILERGPVRASLRVRSEYGRSRLTQELILYAGLASLEVRVTVDWHEQHKLLKLRFPANVTDPVATYEIPYGHIERPADGEEEPGQSWIDVSGRLPDGRAYGLSLLNDGKYSFDIRGPELGLTVLRSPIYAHHVPYEAEPGGDYSFMDQGRKRFKYVLLPHAGTWREAGTVRRAWELNQPAVALAESAHPGPLPSRQSFLSVDQPNIVVSAVKRAEDGGGTVIRCYETDGLAVDTTLSLPYRGRTVDTHLEPYELKTFLLPDDPHEPPRETNLLEWLE